MTPSATLSAGRAESGATRAPLARMLRSELRWIFRRPRTLVALGLLGLVPIVIAIGTAVAHGPSGRGGGNNLFETLIGNGFVLPIVALTLTLNMLLPLAGAMWSADALAGESSHGTLRALLIAPVGRIRLLGIKAFGVATAILAAAVLTSVVGVITGLIVVGSQGMVTLDGTTLGFGDALGRIALATGWVTVQVWAVAAISLAISAFTDHPLVVMAITLAGAIVMLVLGTIPTLSWLQPYLLTSGWTSLTDVLRDPMPTDGLLRGLAEAGCYLLVGLSVALARMSSKDG